jgi:hypothetical protein
MVGGSDHCKDLRVLLSFVEPGTATVTEPRAEFADTAVPAATPWIDSEIAVPTVNRHGVTRESSRWPNGRRSSSRTSTIEISGGAKILQV